MITPLTSSSPPSSFPKMLLIAGEASGDLLGAQCVMELRRTMPHLVVEGLGGHHLLAQGLVSLASMETLSIMGFGAVPKALPALFKLRRQLLQAVDTGGYDGVLTIDAPAFAFWLGPALKKRGVSHIHYVAPTVWAWKPRRAKKIAQFLEAVLCLFPFEPPYFTAHGLAAPFVGHPAVTRYRPAEVPPAPGTLALLPGSRVGEIMTHLPLFLATAQAWHRDHPLQQVVIPTLPHREGLVQNIVTTFLDKKRHQGESCPPVMVAPDPQQHPVVLQSCHLALAASGTVTLELTCAGVPMVVAYRTSWLNAALARRWVRVPYVGMVNILAGRLLVPECLQEACTPGHMVAALHQVAGSWTSIRAALLQLREGLYPRDHQGVPLLPAQAAAQAIVTRWGWTVGDVRGSPPSTI